MKKPFRTFFEPKEATYSEVSFQPCMVVVQARMMSTRLPGKVLKEVLGKPLLFYLIERLRRIKHIEGIVIATTKNRADDVLSDFCDVHSLHCIRGSEEDVLSRYQAACNAFGLDVVVRVTSDCPLFDPELFEKGLSLFRASYDEIDYLSNSLERTYPRGMDFEIFRQSALNEAYHEAIKPSEKEHVTPFIYHHPERYRLANMRQKYDQSGYRLTVDTIEDFELISRLIEALYPTNPEFVLADIITLLEKHPDWAKINAHVEQKKV